MTSLNEKLKARRLELGLTLEEVGNYVGVNKSTVRKWETGQIKDMKRSQIAKYAKILKISPIAILGIDDETISVSLPKEEPVREIMIYGAISCGTGLFVDDEIIGHVSVPLSMLPSKYAEYFAQYASGDSMEGVGIYEGDLLIFEKTQALDNGEIGSFCIDDGITTCKKFSMVGGSVMLMPANDKYQPIIVDPANECFRIIGKEVLRIGK
jgi:repressor LexA